MVIFKKRMSSDGRVIKTEPAGYEKPRLTPRKEMEVGKKKRLRDVNMRFNREEDEFQCLRCLLKVDGHPAIGGIESRRETSIDYIMDVYRSR